jgi:hypothetical protein
MTILISAMVSAGEAPPREIPQSQMRALSPWENFARGRFRASYALDGNPATAWGVDTTVANAYITLDLGRTETVTRLRYRPTQILRNDRLQWLHGPAAYRILVSPDSTDGNDGTWHAVASGACGSLRTATNDAELATWFPPVATRFVRLVAWVSRLGQHPRAGQCCDRRPEPEGGLCQRRDPVPAAAS